MKNVSNKLKKLVQETANSTLGISVNKEGDWYITIGDKYRLNNPSLSDLIEESIKLIEENRVAKEPNARSPKPFTL